MGDCIDLTLDSDEEAPPQNSRPAPAKRKLASPSSDDSDVVVVEEAAEAKRARQEPGEQQEPVDPDADVIVTGATGAVSGLNLAGLACSHLGQQQLVMTWCAVFAAVCCAQVALRDYPHSRPDCGSKLFKKGVHAANSNTCPQVGVLAADQFDAHCVLFTVSGSCMLCGHAVCPML